MFMRFRIILSFLSFVIAGVGFSQTLTVESTGQDGPTFTNITVSSNTWTLTGNASVKASAIVAALANGSLTIKGNSNTFVANINQAISASNVGNGLTLGDDNNTSNITISSAISLAGPIGLYGGAIAINANLSTTNASAILVKAKTNINQASSITVSTTGGAAGSVSYWADSDDNSSGYVQLKINSSITTSGGDIRLGGGTDLTSDFAFGTTAEFCSEYNNQLYISGVHMQSGTQLSSNGGNISVRGQNVNTTNFAMAFGISLKSVTINSGVGKIAIHGVATGSSNVNAQGAASWGTITLRSANTTDEAISIIGDASAVNGTGSSLGINMVADFAVTGNGGGISIDGRAGIATTVAGANIGGDILAASGPITIKGVGVNNVQPINFFSGMIIGRKANSDVPNSSSDVVLQTNGFSMAGTTVDCSGSFTIRSSSDNFPSAFSWPLANLTLTSSVGGLTIGKATNTSDITIASATTISGPVTIYGGNINLDQNINTSGGTASGDVLLKSSGNITQASSKLITTAGGDVTLWSNSDATGIGYVLINGGASSGISTGGGHIFLGGGTILAEGYAKGSDAGAPSFAATGISGVHLGSGSSLLSGNGNITLRGENYGGTINQVQAGVMGCGTTLNAGSGKIAIYGKASGSGTVNAQGISRESTGVDNWIIRSSNSSSDAIQLIGDASFCNNSYTSLGVNFIGTIESSGGGGILLHGKASSATNYDQGLDVRGNVLANSGTITLKGENNSSTDISVFLGTHSTLGTTLGSKAGTNITASTSNVIIQGDNINFNTVTPVNTSGALTIEPVNTSFANAFTYPNANLTVANTISGLTIGKSGNTTNITIGAATSIAGPIALYGASIALSNALTSSNATTGNISLNGTTLTGSSAITLQTGRTLTMNLSANTDYAGAISGSNLYFVKNGAGILSLPTPTALSFAKMQISGGTFRLNSNQQLTLTDSLINNGTFIMKDGATFVQATTGTSVAGSGTFTVEKALAGNAAWSPTTGRFWYMGVPMISVARNSFGSYDANANRLWSYSESTKTYTDITTDAATLSAGTGYVHRRTTNGTLTFSATGVDGLFRTNQSLSGLTRTSGSSVGFNLISNPYMAYLDWDAVIANAGTINIEPTYYIRSAASGNISALITFNGSTNNLVNTSGITVTAEQMNFLAPLQAIWVRVGTAAATGSLAMTRSMLTHQATNPGLKSSTIFPTLARVNLVDGARFDQMLVYLNQDMTNAVDQYDSEKMFTSGMPQLYTMAAGKKLVMNGLNSNKKKISVPLYLELPESKVYNLQLADYNLEDGLILLEDKQEGTIQDFTINDTYAFYANSGVLQNRFVLHFYAPDATITAQGPSNNWVAEEGSYTEGGNILISSDPKGKVQISIDQPETEKVEGMAQVTDANGRIVHSGALEGPTTEFQLNVPSGIYYLTVQSGNMIENKKVFIQE